MECSSLKHVRRLPVAVQCVLLAAKLDSCKFTRNFALPPELQRLFCKTYVPPCIASHHGGGVKLFVMLNVDK